jgi:magnesium-transporting ATPase (P-type)
MNDEARLQAPEWHALSAGEVEARLTTGPAGLSVAEASRRLAEHGPNRLPPGRRRSPLMRLLSQFNNLLIYVLLVSAVIAGVLGHAIDAGVILLVVVLNAIVGYVQEGRAEQALDAVRRMSATRCTVVREGERRTVEAESLVRGDRVILEAGDRVAADLRIVEASAMRIDESALTGESVAVGKTVLPVAAGVALADRRSMSYAGTFVVAGQGSGIVVATALGTELGRISEMLESVDVLTTPLLRQMDRFARQLTLLILVFCAAVFAFAVYRGYLAGEAFMLVVSLAVAAIPEGLPAVMTIAMAVGVQRMASRHAIVRRLPAVEALGSVTVICSDKTGTLTRNQMSVRCVATAHSMYEAQGDGTVVRGVFGRDGAEISPAEEPSLLELTRVAALCNDAELREDEAGQRVHEGDPMETALLEAAARTGHVTRALRRDYPRCGAIPFDAGRRYMATLNLQPDGRILLCVKGAPEVVLAMCSTQRVEQGNAALDVAAWTSRTAELASRGQRVLAVASREMAAVEDESPSIEQELGRDGLTLLGLVGFIDPPRAEAQAAVRECRSAGIRLKMITGDHAATASAIASDLALADRIRTVTGNELDALDDAAFTRAAQEANVLARTNPEHKLRLVEALQAAGEVVAMTGDGVNDAPALKRADIGIAMGGKGTEVAKEAAQIVLTDDNFASIVAAVREGRTVYDNLRKVIAWTLPTNGGELLTIVIAIGLGMTLPMTAVQILWINLVSAVLLGLTLAFEPAEDGVMSRPPRPPRESLISRFLWWRVVLVSVLFAIAALGLFEWVLERGRPLEAARTVVVNAMVVLSIFYLFSIRYLGMTSLTLRGLLGTRAVLIGVGATALAQLAFTYLPIMNRLFGTLPVDRVEAAAIIALGVVLLLLFEVEKFVLRSTQAKP